MDNERKSNALYKGNEWETKWETGSVVLVPFLIEKSLNRDGRGFKLQKPTCLSFVMLMVASRLSMYMCPWFVGSMDRPKVENCYCTPRSVNVDLRRRFIHRYLLYIGISHRISLASPAPS